jgi:cytochrome c oxidase cbb3-type subunit 4
MIPGIITAILLASFIAGTAWAFSGKRRAAFDAAARMPLDDALPGAPQWGGPLGPTTDATKPSTEQAP